MHDALRAVHAGDEITLDWSRARALAPDAHFHLLKAVDRLPSAWVRVGPEGDRSLRHAETDLASPLPSFDLRAANDCEVQSADEYPPTGAAP